VTEIIEVTDLPASIQSAELVGMMVAGANANASRVAPCLTWTDEPDSDTPAPSADQLAEAKLVLVGAVKRWAEAGSGALQQQTAGPFGVTVDTRQRVGFNLWPSEIERLQEICAGENDTTTGAFSITPSASASSHMPWCTLLIGGTYCSCGADLTNYAYPLFEGGVLSDGDLY
jgi:hypothetical protein